ncbi:MAG: hypothetical protein V1929_11935 [bacterium]
MSLNEFRTQLNKRLVHFLWRQWAQLGLASASVETRDEWVIDPEALLLLSAHFGRFDARLFDEIMDWLVKNAAFMNMPRLKSLMKRFGFKEGAVVAAMTDVVTRHNSRLTWRLPVLSRVEADRNLFLFLDGNPLPDFWDPDEIFLRHGYRRGRVELRGLSSRFNAVMPECSLLRLRSLFGVTARAEIVLYLLTHEDGHPSGIARETGYSQKNVQDTLVDMTASSVIHGKQLMTREKYYFMLATDRAPFLPITDKPPRWITWPPLFLGLQRLAEELSELAVKSVSDRLLASELRRIAEEVRPLFEASGFGGALASVFERDIQQFQSHFMGCVEKLLAEIDK